jgi:hypothetical protein
MLWTILCAVLAIVGVVQLLQGQIIFGLILIVVALVIGGGTRGRNNVV